MSKKRAFLVGINYRGTANELRGCINDVINVKQLLISKYGYIESNILVMTDDTPIKPTRANIIEGWKWLLSGSPPSAFGSQYVAPIGITNLFFQYSGHGSRVLDRNSEERDGYDETICPLNFATAGMITDDIIRTELANKVPYNCTLTSLIDACHSESSFDLLWSVTPTVTGSTLTRVGNYTATNGDVMMLSGCRDYQTSADIYIGGMSQGALTYAFLEILKRVNYNISCENLLKSIRTFISTNRLSYQIPCLSFGKTANVSRNFVI